jgi:CheY-like chemotaxis protein
MPVMDGYEAAAEIRALDRPDADVPIIAVSADAYAEDLARCKAAGMDSHISKPIQKEELFAALSQVFSARKSK